MKKLGLYGGTFSPPHLGHTHALELFLEEEKPDRVLVMPTYMPPHKTRAESTSCEDRLAMARLAFRHLPTVEVSDWEIARGGKSYTAVTLQALAREGWRIVFLCGTDMFLTLEEWYSPKTVFELADIVCMPREEDGAMEKLEKKAVLYREKYGATVRILKRAPRELSSTEVRNCISEGNEEKLSKMLTPEVWAYIKEKGLYRK